MKKILEIKFSITHALLMLLIGLFIYVIFLSPNEKTTSTQIEKGYLALLKDPAIIVAIISLIFTYLIIDRWKKIETDIDSVSKNQHSSIKEIQETANKKIDDKVDKVLSRAEGIERKVNNLIESHPWLGLITEHEIIPDIPTCNIVLETSQKLYNLKGKRALVQEYIYFWVGKRSLNNDENKIQLEGTTQDFLKLVDFCQDVLNDEYLSFLILQAGYKFTKTLTPYYLRKLIDYGYIQEAKKVVNDLKTSIKLNYFSKFIAIFYDRYYMNADYHARCLSLIGLYESVKGRHSNSKKYLETAVKLSKSTNTSNYITCVTSEIYYHLGQYAHSLNLLKNINLNETTKEVKKYHNEIFEKVSDYKNNEKLVSEIKTNNKNAEEELQNNFSQNEVNDIEKKSQDDTVTKQNRKDINSKINDNKNSKNIDR